MPPIINGDWDSAWYLWAKVAELQLGKECDIAAGVEQIVKTIRQGARKCNDPRSDQQRADYGAVALFYFARDYRRWREKWPNAERPSLLRVLTSVDFFKYMVRAFDYANKPKMRPGHEPYDRVTLGKAPIKRKHEAIAAAQLFAYESDEGEDSTPAAPPLSKRAKEREKKKKKAAGDKPSPTKGGGAAGDDARKRPRRQERRRRRRRWRPGRRKRPGRRRQTQSQQSATEATRVGERGRRQLRLARHEPSLDQRPVRGAASQARRLRRHRQGLVRVLLLRRDRLR